MWILGATKISVAYGIAPKISVAYGIATKNLLLAHGLQPRKIHRTVG
jgi:hypothetical protein